MTGDSVTPSLIPVRDGAARDQPVPDEQHHQRADGRGDEAGALIRTVMADGLADPGRQKCAGDAEDRGQDKSGRVVRARRQHPRDDPGDKADDDDPEYAAHGDGPFMIALSSESLPRT